MIDIREHGGFFGGSSSKGKKLALVNSVKWTEGNNATGNALYSPIIVNNILYGRDSATPARIALVDLKTLKQIGLSANTGGVGGIVSHYYELKYKNGYFFINGKHPTMSSSTMYEIRKLDDVNFSTIARTGSSNNMVTRFEMDDEFLYATFTGRAYIRKYSLEDLSFVSSASVLNGTATNNHIKDLKIDGDFIYVGGAVYSNSGGEIIKVRKDDFSRVAMTELFRYTTAIEIADDDFLLSITNKNRSDSSEGDNLLKIDKETMEIVAEVNLRSRDVRLTDSLPGTGKIKKIGNKVYVRYGNLSLLRINYDTFEIEDEIKIREDSLFMVDDQDRFLITDSIGCINEVIQVN